MAGRGVDKSVDGVGKAAGRAPVVAALDLGQSKVACFIMKADGVRHADRTIRVAGAGHVQSRGVRGGGIVNMDEAARPSAMRSSAPSERPVRRSRAWWSPRRSARWPAIACRRGFRWAREIEKINI